MALSWRVLEQRTERLQPKVDALGVVEPIQPEDDMFRIAQLGPDLGGTLAHCRGLRHLLELRSVDGDRGRLEMHRPAAPPQVTSPDRLCAGDAPRRPSEVGGALSGLERDHVGAQKALDDLPSPRQTREDLDRRERDVKVEPNRCRRHHRSQHLGYELQLVVLDPGDVAGPNDLSRRFGISTIHCNVRAPRVSVVLGRHDGVVVERPQGAVAEPVVEAIDFFFAQRHGSLVDAVVLERWRIEVGNAGPADPCAVRVLQHRPQRTYQSARADRPLLTVPRNGKSVRLRQ